MTNQTFTQTFRSGAVIFREGEPGDAAYIIDKGLIEISSLQQGEKHVLALLSDGEIFGEMALIDSGLRSATATAVQDTEVLVINRKYVRERMENSDPLLKLFLQVILKRLRDYARGNVVQPPPEGGIPLRPRPTLVPVPDQEHVLTQLRFQQDLLSAFEKGQFEPYFQAIVSMETGDIAGFEVLIRWIHPVRGLVAPDAFIGVMEETGLIVPIGLWIFDAACQALARLQERHDRHEPHAQPLYLSINASSRQFLDPHFIGQVGGVINRHNVDPRQIVVEITENVLMENPEHAALSLERLKELGLRISVDDFGTGYSSLNYLHRFPIDVLKIDRAFVSSMLLNRKSMGIVRAITELARVVRMDVVAEGIEEEAQLRPLQEFGCRYGQGFLFSRPLSEPQACQLLEAKRNWSRLLVDRMLVGA